MALDKLVDSTQLDADLASVANAIRTKGGTSAQLAFPADFVSAIASIPSGGGATAKTGTITFASATKDLSISGIDITPVHFVIMADNDDMPTDSTWKTLGYLFPVIGHNGVQINRNGASNWNGNSRAASFFSFENGTITLTANYNFAAGITYYWAVW